MPLSTHHCAQRGSNRPGSYTFSNCMGIFSVAEGSGKPRQSAGNLTASKCDNDCMRFRLLRLAALMGCLASVICAQQQLTVEKLTGFIDSSIKQHIPDREVAAYLATARMSERLTPAMVEDMQGK